jgi:hypothetical protein
MHLKKYVAINVPELKGGPIALIALEEKQA